MAKGIKDEPYSKESQGIDLEEFRTKLNNSLSGVKDPRTVLPTIILPIILLTAIYYGKSELLDVALIHFIPVIWGIWNALYFAICKNCLPGGVIGRYIISGGILGLILALYAVFVAGIPEILGFVEYQYYPLVFVPIGYAIVWLIIVKPLNNFLGVKE